MLKAIRTGESKPHVQPGNRRFTANSTRLRCVRRRSFHIIADMGLVLLKILDEHANQFDGLFVIGDRVSPGSARVQQCAIDARHRDWYFKPEIRISAKLGAVQ